MFYNHERFRIWQAQARFRAILSTALVVPVIGTYMSGFKDGMGYLKKNWMLFIIGTAGMFVSTFYIHHRLVGYNNQVLNE